ncbi:MAG: ATP-dependent DNA helicase [Pseudomonadota bacterium]|nr:ATP-dependent DNA helicase [Pseudomonadota bacterium]
MFNFTDFFGVSSPLKSFLAGFRPRQGQANMSEDVMYAIENKQRLIIEAGTGIGKTFAYLVPALVSGKKIIISTGTKSLQDQLFHRDFPLITKVIGRPVTASLLKGRSNYLCLYRLDNASSNKKAISHDLHLVNKWRHQTATGDCSELIGVSEDSAVWPMVTSTIENCLGNKCPDYKDCYVVKARKIAQESGLVVINHHLLFADLVIKEEGFANFLPEAEVIILDEVHQIPDIATQFFGLSIGTIEIERLVKDALLITIPLNQPAVIKKIDNLKNAIRQFRLDAPKKEGRYEFFQIEDKVNQSLQEILLALEELKQILHPIIDTKDSIEKIFEITDIYHSRLLNIINPDLDDGLRWIDIKSRGIRLNMTPLDVGFRLRILFSHIDQTWIFTSATIAIGSDFSHFRNRMGLNDAVEISYPSPYKLDDNALIYLPKNLIEVSNKGFTESMLEATVKLLGLIGGGVFFLFTSNHSLREAEKWFDSRNNILKERPLLVQGRSPRDDMLKKFREYGNAVLLGTKSFWEGVDVRGNALNMVVIDKLPFKSPADPLMMARLEFIKKNGGNGFIEHQLPSAVLALKQGVGRLLRDQSDYGVIVICDNRIKNKNYGDTFIKSLSPMKFTESKEEVAGFLEKHKTIHMNSNKKEH